MDPVGVSLQLWGMAAKDNSQWILKVKVKSAGADNQKTYPTFGGTCLQAPRSTGATADVIQPHRQAPHNITRSWHSVPAPPPITSPITPPHEPLEVPVLVCLYHPWTDFTPFCSSPTPPSPFLVSISLLYFSSSSHPDVSLYQVLLWAQSTSLQVSHLCSRSMLRPIKSNRQVILQCSPHHAGSLGMQHRTETCFLCLTPERGPGDTGPLMLSLGQCRACGTKRRGSQHPLATPTGPRVALHMWPSYPFTRCGSHGQQGPSPFHPLARVSGLCHQLCSLLLFQQTSKLLQDQESIPCCTEQQNKTALISELWKQKHRS